MFVGLFVGYPINIIVEHDQMNIRTHVRRYHMADEKNTLMFVCGAWTTNVSHVSPCPPNCHVCSMFIGSSTNIKGHVAVPPALRGNIRKKN
jgi:hypothetical protein